MEEYMKIRKLSAVLLMMASILLSVAYAETEGDWTYTLSAEGAVIMGYTGTDKEIQTPKVLGGKPVIAIGEAAFEKVETIRRIVVSEGVERIEKDAFTSAHIEEIILPETLKSIGSSALWATRIKNIVIPDGVVEIGDQALKWSDIRSVALPKGIEKIPGHMFSLCEYLSDVSIPDNVKIIDQLAFYGCKMLTEIELPEGVEKISFEAFEKCSALERIVIPASVTQIDATAFRDCQKLVAYVYEDSYAHRWCIDNHVSYVLIGVPGQKPEGVLPEAAPDKAEPDRSVLNNLPKTGDSGYFSFWFAAFVFAALAGCMLKRRTV